MTQMYVIMVMGLVSWLMLHVIQVMVTVYLMTQASVYHIIVMVTVLPIIMKEHVTMAILVRTAVD